MNYVNSAFFLITVIALLCGLLFIRRKECKENLAVSMPLAAILVMCFHGFAGGVLWLTHVPIGCLSIGMIDAMAAIAIWLNISKRGIQIIEYSWFDLVAQGLIVIGVLVFTIHFYGKGMSIHFGSVDGAAHASMALNIYRYGEPSNNLFLPAVNTALVMNALSPLLESETECVSVFISMECIYFALHIQCFYGIISQQLKTNKWISLIILPLYAFGYPIYSTIMGFSYFGVSVTIIAAIIMMLMDTEISFGSCFYVIAMHLLLYGLFISYTFFVPLTFFAVFLYFLLQSKQEMGKNYLKSATKMELKIFLPPTIIGLLFSIGDLAKIKGQNGAGIFTDGGCYMDLYSNFVLLFPLAFYGVLIVLQSKKRDISLCFLTTLVLFMGVLFVFSLKGKVSAYYFSKNYNLLWLLTYYFIIKALSQLFETINGRKMAMAFILSICLITSALIGNFDGKVKTRTDRLIQIGADAFVNIYAFNLPYMYVAPNQKEQLRLFEQAGIICNRKNVAIVGGEEDYCWLRVFAREVEYYQDQQNADYVVIPRWASDGEKLSGYELVFENDYGFLYKKQSN